MVIKRQHTTFIILAVLVFLLTVIVLIVYSGSYSAFLITSLWVLILALLIPLGNRYISMFLNKKLPWEKYLSVRFFVQLISVLIYSLVCFNISYFIFKLVFTNDPPAPDQIAMVNIYGSLVVLPVFSIYYVIHFINQWKKTQVKSEKLEKDSIKSELLNLKNHLDPHFLFNNLNILSSLIDIDKEGSKQYLSKFAEVYRFMLQTKSTELISLRQELDFIDAYFHLIATRFQDALYLKKNISPDKLEFQLPPLTLQLLIENAIKHNSFSRKEPLLIEINETEDGALTIKNNIKRLVMPATNSGTGLKNIRDRYQYFTDNNVKISDNGRYFEVRIPLIEIEEI